MVELSKHVEDVREEWIDAYGHLNEAHYLIPFTNAMWPMQDELQFGLSYTARTGNAIYTVEGHARYLGEVRAPATLVVENFVVGVDEKRLWTAQVLRVDGREVATFERLSLNFHQPTRKVVSFPNDLQAILRSAMPPVLPDWVGRTGLPKRS